MSFKLEDLPYQRQAIDAVVRLFDGQQRNYFDLDLRSDCYTRTRRDDFTENAIYEVSDHRRSALVCLAWHESIDDSTIKKLRDLAESGHRPFFICLECGLTTTAKWNLKHFLGNHFNAF